MKRIFSFVLAALLLVSAVPTALATNDYSQGTQVVYEAANQEAYTITVPASMQPGDEGTVTLQGTWASDRVVTITADKTVTLTNSINAADQKTLDIGFAGMEYAGNNTEAKTYTETVSVAEMPESALFGTWSGKFNYNVGIADYINLNPDDGSTPADGDTYSAGDYNYTYNAANGGWAVTLNANVTDKNQSTYGKLLESINGEPVTNITGTFANCPNLTVAPEIPASVTNMTSTFLNCTGLTVAPVIPEGVTDMTFTFRSCTSLTTAPVIPSSVTNMHTTFQDCTSLTTAPVIPTGVTNMNFTFRGCTSLTTAPEIPNGVEYMSLTFYDCANLTAAPAIPDSVIEMTNTFSGCASLTGEISIPCSLANQNYTYTDCSATITYYHIDGCDGSCGK